MKLSNFLYYYRVSSREQETDGRALERYREQGIALGIPESNLYYDVESGRSRTRKGLLEACDRLQFEESIEGLVVPFHSRLHRNENTWLEVKSILIANKLKFIDLSKGVTPIDLESVEGEFGTSLDSILAIRQSRIIQRHSIDGHAKRRRDKRSMIPPFGYKLSKDNKLEPRLDEYKPGISYWAAASQIVSWYLESGNYSYVCDKSLKEWGQRPRGRDRPGSPRGLKLWLQNPAIRGSFFDSQKDQITEVDAHPVLVDQETWTQLKSSIGHARAPRGPSHRLSKIVFCGYCNSVMRRTTSIPSRGKTKYEYLMCLGYSPNPGKPKICDVKNFQSYRKIEDEIIKQLMTQAKKAAELTRTLIPSKKYSKEVDDLLKEIEVLKQVTNAESLVESKRKEVTALLKEDGNPNSVDVALIKNYYAAMLLPNFWESGTLEERAVAFRTLLSKVLVFADGVVEVEFNFEI